MAVEPFSALATAVLFVPSATLVALLLSPTTLAPAWPPFVPIALSTLLSLVPVVGALTRVTAALPAPLAMLVAWLLLPLLTAETAVAPSVAWLPSLLLLPVAPKTMLAAVLPVPVALELSLLLLPESIRLEAFVFVPFAVALVVLLFPAVITPDAAWLPAPFAVALVVLLLPPLPNTPLVARPLLFAVELALLLLPVATDKAVALLFALL